VIFFFLALFFLADTFLILCCIVPTCCAYRRRRQFESRFSEQQRSSFERLQELQHQAQQNMFILSNLHQLRASTADGGGEGSIGGIFDPDGESSALDERTRRIKTAIKDTTFVVKSGDIIILQSNDGRQQKQNEEEEVSSTVNIRHAKDDNQKEEEGGDKGNHESTTKDVENGGESGDGDVRDGNSDAIDYYDADGLNMDHYLLRLPHTGICSNDCDDDDDNDGGGDEECQTPVPPQNANRTVPGGCAICLSAYEVGDSVSWSKEDGCVHVFHTDCIVPWLAKKSEPHCPCCRRPFCTYERVMPTDLITITPFGLVSSSSMMAYHPSISSRRFIYPIVSPTTEQGATTMTTVELTRSGATTEVALPTNSAHQSIFTVDDVDHLEGQASSEHQQQQQQRELRTLVTPDLVASHQVLEQQQNRREQQRQQQQQQQHQ
jgi:Ring finger domain